MGGVVGCGVCAAWIPSKAFSPQQVVHEIRNYPYPQLHFLALQGLNPSRHTSAVRESYEVRPPRSLAPAGLVETPLWFMVPSPFLPLVGRAWEVAGSFRVESKREKKREQVKLLGSFSTRQVLLDGYVNTSC